MTEPNPLQPAPQPPREPVPQPAKESAASRLGRRAIWLFVTMLVAGTLAIPAAYILIPHVHRWTQIDNLTSPDLEAREQALAYVAAYAAEDERVLKGALEKLKVDDRDNFLHIANALDVAGLWQHPPVPADPWLRWLTMLSQADDDENARVIAAQKLADARDLAGDPRTHAALQRLLADPNEIVRYNALVSAADQAGKAQGEIRATLLELMLVSISDEEDEIARQAWIFLGLLGAADQVEYDPEQLADPLIGQAIVWARTRSRPAQPKLALSILAGRPGPNHQAVIDWQTAKPDQAKHDPQLEAMAVYALRFSQAQEAQAALKAIYPRDHPYFARWAAPWDDLVVWRAALVAPYHGKWQEELRQLAEREGPLPSLQMVAHESMPSIMQARYSVLGHQVATFNETLARYPTAPLMTLAWAESVLAADETRPINLGENGARKLPPMVRLFATAAAESPEPHWIRELFDEEQAPLRDLACVIAADRFSDAQNETLVHALLTDYNDNAKMSGGILAGLTGTQTKLLVKAAEYEDVWAVKQILRLGLWMQGLEPQMDLLAPALLTREDLPTTSILLAMLHKDRPEALEYLLTPRGDERTLSPFALGLAQRRTFDSSQLVTPPAEGDGADEGINDDDANDDDGANDDGTNDDGTNDDDGANDDGAGDDGTNDDGAGDDGTNDDDGANDDGAGDDGANNVGADVGPGLPGQSAPNANGSSETVETANRRTSEGITGQSNPALDDERPTLPQPLPEREGSQTDGADNDGAGDDGANNVGADVGPGLPGQSAPNANGSSETVETANRRAGEGITGQSNPALDDERPTLPQPLPEREGSQTAGGQLVAPEPPSPDVSGQARTYNTAPAQAPAYDPASTQPRPNDISPETNEDADAVERANSQNAGSGSSELSVPNSAERVADLLQRAEPVTLVQLFDELRWWYVVSRYLPDDAPHFDVWGDPLLMQYQVDTLRNWYLLNRPAERPATPAPPASPS